MTNKQRYNAAHLRWQELTYPAAFKAGFTPFILGEALKIAITATSLPLVWRRISRSLNR